jgi:hypothetical protein
MAPQACIVEQSARDSLPSVAVAFERAAGQSASISIAGVVASWLRSCWTSTLDWRGVVHAILLGASCIHGEAIAPIGNSLAEWAIRFGCS